MVEGKVAEYFIIGEGPRADSLLRARYHFFYWAALKVKFHTHRIIPVNAEIQSGQLI